MRVYTLLIFLLLLSIAEINAQVVLNPKLGFNVSAVDEELGDFEAKGRAGFNVGLDIRVPGENTFYFNPGIHYYNYTARLVTDTLIGGVELKEKTTIRAIKIPARVGLRLTGEGGILGIHIRGGLIGTLIAGVKVVDDFNFDKDALKPFTLGADLGVMLGLINLITVDLNYEIGLTDYFEVAEGGNNVVTMNFGLKF